MLLDTNMLLQLTFRKRNVSNVEMRVTFLSDDDRVLGNYLIDRNDSTFYANVTIPSEAFVIGFYGKDTKGYDIRRQTTKKYHPTCETLKIKLDSFEMLNETSERARFYVTNLNDSQEHFIVLVTGPESTSSTSVPPHFLLRKGVTRTVEVDFFVPTSDSGRYAFAVRIFASRSESTKAAGSYTYTFLVNANSVEINCASTFWTIGTIGPNGTGTCFVKNYGPKRGYFSLHAHFANKHKAPQVSFSLSKLILENKEEKSVNVTVKMRENHSVGDTIQFTVVAEENNITSGRGKMTFTVTVTLNFQRSK